MYQVSNAYKIAMKKPVTMYKVRGKIADVDFNDSNILRDTFIIANQGSDTNDLRIGQVFVGELEITLVNLELSNYNLTKKQISMEIGLKLEDDTYEYVPMGIFTIQSAKHSKDGLSISAYDNMQKLDKKYSSQLTKGNLYQLTTLACEMCGVELANSEQDFKSLPNADRDYSLYVENDIETIRDLFAWIAQTVGCYVTANREGKIEFRKYNQNVVDEFNPEERFNDGSFSNYTTRYARISLEVIEDETVVEYGIEGRTGSTYKLGANPFLQNLSKAKKEECCRNILNALTAIEYTPFEMSIPPLPLYDLGDVFRFRNGLSDSTKLYCLNKSSYNYNKSLQMQGVGANPFLADARSATDKSVTGAESENKGQEIRFNTFTNTAEVVVGNDETRAIINTQFAVSKNTHLAIRMQINLNIETVESESDIAFTENDANCIFHYYLNGEEQYYQPKADYQDGKHIVNLMYEVDVGIDSIYTWAVFLNISNGIATINSGDIIGTIFGAGLVEELPWDGNINLQDDIGSSIIDDVRFIPIIDNGVQISVQEPIKFNFTSEIENAIIKKIDIIPATDWLSFNPIMANKTWGDIQDNQELWENINNKYIWGVR